MELSGLYVREGQAINKAQGALLVAEHIPGTKYNEIVDVKLSNGEIKSGQAIDISEEATIVQVFGGVSEIDLKGSTIRCKGETLKLPVSTDMLGRIFNGMGKPIDGGPQVIADEYLDINGEAINPASRMPPAEFIETGISSIDGLNVLVRGQKLPIFSGAGLPHDELTAQFARQATVLGEGEQFAVVFAAMGITFEAAQLATLERYWWFLWGIRGLVLAVSLWLVKGLDDYETIPYGYVPVYFLTAPTFYYHVMIWLPFFLFLPKRDQISRAIGAAGVFGVSILLFILNRSMPIYVAFSWRMSALLLGLVLYMAVVCAITTARPQAASEKP